MKTETKKKVYDLDDLGYFEEWWSRQPLVYRQSQEHYNLAKFRWDKIKQFLKDSRNTLDKVVLDV